MISHHVLDPCLWIFSDSGSCVAAPQHPDQAYTRLSRKPLHVTHTICLPGSVGPGNGQDLPTCHQPPGALQAGSEQDSLLPPTRYP